MLLRFSIALMFVYAFATLILLWMVAWRDLSLRSAWPEKAAQQVCGYSLHFLKAKECIVLKNLTLEPVLTGPGDSIKNWIIFDLHLSAAVFFVFIVLFSLQITRVLFNRVLRQRFLASDRIERVGEAIFLLTLNWFVQEGDWRALSWLDSSVRVQFITLSILTTMIVSLLIGRIVGVLREFKLDNHG